MGLHRLRSHDVIDLQTCLVLDPALVALIPALRALPLDGLRKAGTALANVLDNGIDLLLRTDAPLTPADRRRLAAFAAQTGCTRISWAPGDGPYEPASQRDTPVLTIAGAAVSPPPGAFLQASRTGQAAITAAVLAGLPPRMTGRSRIIELFAGCGTLTFPLAEHARVLAFEGDAGAVAALRKATAGRRIDATHRDLARQPLSAKELADAAAVVLDPPHAGAAQQMRAITQAAVPRVIYVSCNPAALARDGAMLHAAGYALLAATPIDQFLWSDAVECVAVFGTGKSARGR